MASTKKARLAKTLISVASEKEKNANVSDDSIDEQKMARIQLDQRINRLLDQEDWQSARKLLEIERLATPQSHWVVTQLAVTHYEERNYQEALRLLLISLDIKDDCPLTLWNLAGTLDALGKHEDAHDLYVWIFKSKRTPTDDPCWESDEWTASLKADSVFRLGWTALNRGEKHLAERFFRDYLDLWLAGVEGSYSIETVVQDVHHSRGVDSPSGVKKESREINATGAIPRSALKQSAGIYSPVIKLPSFLLQKNATWKQLLKKNPRGRSVALSKRSDNSWKGRKLAGQAD